MNELENLLEFVRSDKRVCPKPQVWQKLWDMLPNKKRTDQSWQPPLPLILAAWWETSDEQKRQRLAQHVKYAFKNNELDDVIKYLTNLQPKDWVYEDEV